MTAAPQVPRALTPVSDATDPRLDDYARLRERDRERAAEGLFVVEGGVVLDVALGARARFPLRSVLVSERRVSRWSAHLERVPVQVPVYVVPDAVLEQLAGFDLHKGLVAIGERREEPGPGDILSQPGEATVLLLEGLTNTDNVGACFRNAAAFGARGILLDERSCDPLYRRALRVSVGHGLAVPFARAPLPALLEALRGAGYTLVALALQDGASALSATTRRPADRLAVMVGEEGRGLSAEAIQAADRVVRVPMAPGVDSLNVATAAALALFVWAQGHRAVDSDPAGGTLSTSE